MSGCAHVWCADGGGLARGSSAPSIGATNGVDSKDYGTRESPVAGAGRGRARGIGRPLGKKCERALGGFTC